MYFNAQGTAELLAIEDTLVKKTSDDDLPAAGEPTEKIPNVDALSLLCGYPRSLVSGDIFRTQSKNRSGNKILKTPEWQLEESWNIEDLVTDSDFAKFVPIENRKKDSLLDPAAAIRVEKSPGTDEWSLLAEVPSNCK